MRADIPASMRAAAYSSLGSLIKDYGEMEQAENLVQRAIALYREAGDQAALTETHKRAGWVALYRGDYDRASDHFEEALSVARTMGDRLLIANVLAAQCAPIAMDGDYEHVEALGAESMQLYRDIGDRLGEAQTLAYLGYIALWRQNLSSADRLARECMTAAQELGSAYLLAFATRLLGEIALERGEYIQAETLFIERLRYAGNWHPMTTATTIEGLAGVAVGLGRHERAARLLGAATGLREKIGSPLAPVHRGRYDRTLAAIRSGLTEEAYEAAHAEGWSWTLPEAVEFALVPPSAEAPELAVSPIAGLTPRELDVLQLLVEGLSDREIAERLFISPYTVGRHVSNILAKLDVDSRTAAATWAVRSGLT
jgi:DNA-binding CsgD family transcriptional regulator